MSSNTNIPSGSNLYSAGFGTTSSNTFSGSAIRSTRSPSSTDVRGPQGNFPIGQTWVDTSIPAVFTLASFSVTGGVVSANWLLSALNAGDLETLSGDTGTAVPSSSNIQIAGGAGITTSASGSTVTVSLTSGGNAIDSLLPNSGVSPVVPNIDGEVALTGNGSLSTVGGTNILAVELTGLLNHHILAGAGTPTITSIPPTVATGIPLVSQGSSADPSFSTATVPGGGTGVTSNTAYAVLCGGTTSTNPIQSIASVGTANEVLTSNGAGALPTFQNVAASGAATSFNGNTGTATPAGGVVTITTGASNAQGTSRFTGAAATLTQTFTDGSSNTGLGLAVLDALTSGTSNTALGANALSAVSTATECTAVGNIALAVATGGFNTAVGSGAAQALTTGTGNSVLGQGAMRTGTTNTDCVAIGRDALRDSTANNITAVGTFALANHTSGTENTALGFSAGAAITTATSNVCVGHGAGDANQTGNGNTAVGHNALSAATIGALTAVGSSALATCTTGVENTAVGVSALGNVTTGNTNTAVGYVALGGATNNASSNTAVGSQVGLSITTGNSNTAMGYVSLASCTTGARNQGLGQQTLNAITTGNDNVCIGYQAGIQLTGSDSNNIVIGSGITSVAGDNNTTRIGVSMTRTFISGIRGITTANADAINVLIDSAGQLGTVSSSLRYKENIKPITNSSRIYDLNPVTFKYKSQESSRPQYGLIAEEVNKVIPEIVVRNAEGEVDTIQYQTLPIFLLAEIQRLNKRIEELEKRVK